MSTKKLPSLATYAEVCEALSIGLTTLHKLIAAGELERRRMNSPGAKRPICRVTAESVIAYQRRGASSPTASEPARPPHVKPPMSPAPGPGPGRFRRVPSFV